MMSSFFLCRKLHLSSGKPTKPAATKDTLFDSNMTKSFVGWGFAPEPTENVYSALPDLVALFMVPTAKGSGSVAEWLACWTQAQKARVQIAVATLSGNSLRQTVHTHCASVHQAAKLVAAVLRVAGVTAGQAESNGSLYRRVYDSRHLQANCQEPGSAPEPYAR